MIFQIALNGCVCDAHGAECKVKYETSHLTAAEKGQRQPSGNEYEN